MAPPTGKRVKGVQILRPFVYGTTAKPFDEKTNPKPPGVPDDHTHSWTVFIKGIDDVDITYWLRRVQFKLHESIPNHVRMVEGIKGQPFQIHETGWGEFEITMKLYYVPESSEKPQTLYHHLRLHPFGRTEEEKEAMRLNGGEVISWVYEEQIFNEPYEPFYEILTSGALPPSASTLKDGGGGGGGSGAATPTSANTPGASSSKGGNKKGHERSHSRASVSTNKDGKNNNEPKEEPFVIQRSEGGVLERSAMIPLVNRPGQPFSRETEQLEIQKLKEAKLKVDEMKKQMMEDLEKKQKRLEALRAENAQAA
ncbi:protein AF-9 [Neurospora tetraspora]|uniref:Protein AF-9 homolog n=1 Tax=Neurospora tetraspora TaxID=94610 RepID=A0AAE0JB22_9PEZI|nr:protein AF-9 [Neurospora tetraspora]